MCGIAAYIGEKKASTLLLHAIKRLDYRGYDSVGMAIVHNGKLLVRKGVGKVDDVNKKVHFEEIQGSKGIAHTRWATTGKVNDANAHPHVSSDNRIAVVHNGIIENHLELKEELRREGVTFVSDTDTEVIVHLVAKYYEGNLRAAVLKTVHRLQGSYALCVLAHNAESIIGAKNGSPLIVGIGKGENMLASDVSAIVEHTKQVVYIEDFEIVEITKDAIKVYDFEGKEKRLQVKTIDWDLEQAQKGGHKHFMLKEIFDQPKVAEDTQHIQFSLKKDFSRIIIVACGTASYAGLLGRYLIESVAKIPALIEIGSEFRYREPLISKNDFVIAISQSGETADTLAAVKLAKQHGAKTLGIVNVVGSSIAREVDEVIYTRAGPELSVASTKAFLSQIIVLYKLAFGLAGKQVDVSWLPAKINHILTLNEEIRKIAHKYYQYHHFMYIGRKRNYPMALEGAIKLKEISYIHAEAYPAGELKHGPIALISEEVPTFAICPQDGVYTKTMSNIEEIKARNGKVIAIATEGDKEIAKLVDDVIFIPKVDELFYPLLITIPIQLFAYHVADLRSCDIDKPRNLAKSVTVE